MANDIKSGLIDTVVITELSRVSRSVIDFLNFAQFLKNHHADFVCLKQQFDTISPSGKVLVTICVALAEFERELTSERTSENMLARARRGLRNGGQLLGYDLNPEKKGHLIPNPAESVLVNHIFDKYLELGSMKKVAHYLNKAGYRTKGFTAKSGKVHKPKRFITSMVQWVLHNRSYIGENEINRMSRGKDQASLPEKKKYATTKSVWPAIVERSKFEEVQKLLRINGQTRKNAAAKVTHNYILRGLVRCGNCGCTLEDGSGTSKTGDLHFYYRHRSADRKKGCALPSLRAQTLEKLVLGRLSYLADRQDIIADIAKDASRNLADETPKVLKLLGERKREYARLTQELEQCAQKVLELDNASLKELIVPKVAELKDAREKVAEEMRLLQKSLDELKGNAVSAVEIQEMLQSFETLYQELPPHKQKELLAYIIHSITVRPTHIEMALFGRATLDQFTLAGGVFAGNTNWLRD